VPSASPFRFVECVSPSLISKVPVIEAKAVSVAAYLHVEASFVLTVNVLLVVPAGSTWFAVGVVIVAVGGVVSCTVLTLKLTLALLVMVFPAVSWQRTNHV
jgi:hypothetical protein